MKELTLTRPDDWHLHVRDGAALHTVVPHTAAQFGRAIIMPNLKPPVTTAEQALAYKARIQAAVPAGVAFEPLMTLYLTDNLPADEIARAKDAGVVAVKLYPAGATTNSDAGVTDLRNTYKTLGAMQKAGLPLLVHGEVTSPDIDLFDREAVFIDTQLIPLRRDFPELKIVFEHITTREAAQYVQSADRFTAATITAHHLLYNRNAIFTGGIRPHYYCLPVLKRETHPASLQRQLDALWQKNLKAIGINSEFLVAQWPENLKATQAGRFQVWGVGSSASQLDGQGALQRLYGPSSGAANLSRFKSKEFDALYDRMQSLPDGPEREMRERRGRARRGVR